MTQLFKLLCLCGVALLCAHAAPAQDQPSINVNVDGASIAAFWTAERLKGAKPFVGSGGDAAPAQAVAAAASAALGASADATINSLAGVPGSEPTASNTVLFNVSASGEASGRAARAGGTLGGYYSSTALIPYTADTYYPYRTVGKMYFTIPTGTGSSKTPGSGYWCTAAVIQRRLIVTAGGCLHSGKNGQSGWFKNFYFVPAMRDGGAPYGTWSWTGKAVTSWPWYQGGGTYPNLADFGLVQLNLNGAGSRIGTVVGWLGWGSNLLSGNILHQLGYSTTLNSGLRQASVYTTPFRVVGNSNYEFATPIYGASGPPLIQNFGNPSSGETAGTYRTARNTIAGVTSYYYLGTGPLASGTSSFGASSNFGSMWTQACGWSTNTCA